MNNPRALLLIVGIFAFGNVQADPNYTPSTSSTGTILKKGPRVPDIEWNSKIPLNRTYAELTPEQRAQLNAMYDSLAPGDEPPFPEDGIKPIRNAQRKLHAVGELNMTVTVGPDGVATKVEDLGNVRTEKMTEIARQALMSTRYKPAMCNGAPCTMQFHFVQTLKSAG
jgi:hypothetical protein